MKTILRFYRLADTAKNRNIVARELEPIVAELPVDKATVTVDMADDSGDRYEASVHLEVPGPDIHDSAKDYTVQAAWRKIARQIKDELKRRLNKRQSERSRPRLSAAQNRA